MQTQAYLDRIGFAGAHDPDLPHLQRLVRCHLETVPFENLDFYHSPREISLKTADLYDKVVNRHRGGVCFELNGLFYWLLKELGYRCYPVSVRIYDPSDPSAPITHQGVVVLLGKKKYYCDVGFGGPGPQGVLCLDETAVQNIAGDPFRVEQDSFRYRIFRTNKQGDWVQILSFADDPSDPEDFEILFYYFTANPKSGFVTDRVVNLTCNDGSLALSGKTFTRRKNGEMIRQELPDEEAVARILKTEFGLE